MFHVERVLAKAQAKKQCGLSDMIRACNRIIELENLVDRSNTQMSYWYALAYEINREAVAIGKRRLRFKHGNSK